MESEKKFFSSESKLNIAKEWMASKSTAKAISYKYGVSISSLYRWKSEFKDELEGPKADVPKEESITEASLPIEAETTEEEWETATIGDLLSEAQKELLSLTTKVSPSKEIKEEKTEMPFVEVDLQTHPATSVAVEKPKPETKELTQLELNIEQLSLKKENVIKTLAEKEQAVTMPEVQRMVEDRKFPYFAPNLTSLMSRFSKDHHELAKITQISAERISLLWLGKRPPTLLEVQTISTALGIELDYFDCTSKHQREKFIKDQGRSILSSPAINLGIANDKPHLSLVEPVAQKPVKEETSPRFPQEAIGSGPSKIAVYEVMFYFNGHWLLGPVIDEIVNPYPNIDFEVMAIQLHDDSMSRIHCSKTYALVKTLDEKKSGNLYIVATPEGVLKLRELHFLSDGSVEIKTENHAPVATTLNLPKDEFSGYTILGEYIGSVSPLRIAL